MSAPRYRIIIVGAHNDHKVARKCKSRFGNVKELEEEIALMCVRGEISRMTDMIDYEKAKEDWSKQYLEEFGPFPNVEEK